MSTRTRITLFGLASGLLWSLAPIYFSGRYYFGDGAPEIFYIYPTLGIITGILVSFTLYKPLLKLKPRGVLCLGLLALPIGAFYFSLFAGLADIAGGNIGVGGSFLQALPGLFFYGLFYICALVMMSLSYTGLILFSSAVITTYLLRLTILQGGGGPDKAPATT